MIRQITHTELYTRLYRRQIVGGSFVVEILSSSKPSHASITYFVLRVPLLMLTDVLVHKCLPMQMFTDVCGSPMLTDVLVTDV